jgi:hypothetical protein
MHEPVPPSPIHLHIIALDEIKDNYTFYLSFLINWGGVRVLLVSRPSFDLLYQPQMMDNDEC